MGLMQLVATCMRCNAARARVEAQEFPGNREGKRAGAKTAHHRRSQGQKSAEPEESDLETGVSACWQCGYSESVLACCQRRDAMNKVCTDSTEFLVMTAY